MQKVAEVVERIVRNFAAHVIKERYHIKVNLDVGTDGKIILVDVEANSWCGFNDTFISIKAHNKEINIEIKSDFLNVQVAKDLGNKSKAEVLVIWLKTIDEYYPSSSCPEVRDNILGIVK